MVESVVQSHAEMVVDSKEKSRIRVLHVDDELGLLKATKQCLELQGPFQVDTASSVEEALAKLEKEQYDAVVSDYQMPGKDGLEFLKELRENGNRIPFIMFTGKGREEVAIRALNLGANQYLDKTGETETVYTELAHAITELAKTKRAEELLGLSEEKYKGLFENARDVIVLLDLKGNVTSINKAAEEYGFNKSEMLGKSMLRFISKKHWPRLLKDVAQIGLGKTAKGRIDIYTPKGARMAEYRSNPIFSCNRVVGIQTVLEDVTEREKAGEALRESEEKYKDLFENAMDVILTLDLKGSITAVNNSVLRFGYKREDLVGKNILDFVPKENRPAVMRDFSKVAQGEPVKSETELVVPAGKIFVEYNAGAIVKENNVAGVQINIRDETERKKAEEALRNSEDNYRSLFEKAGDGLVYVDLKGKIININAKAAEIAGVNGDQLVGKSVFRLGLVGWRDIPMLLGRIKARAKGNPSGTTLDLSIKRKDGEERLIEVTPTMMRKEGKPVGQVAIVRDVTDKRNIERSLRESQARFEGLFIGNPEAAAYLDPHFRIRDINPRFEELFGYSLEEVKGRDINDAVIPSNLKKEGESLDREARKGYVHRDTVRKRKDGMLINVSVSAAPIVDDRGVSGVVAMYHDISDRKNAEKRLDAINEKLRVVGSLTRHDVRNKLTAVVGNTYLLRKRFTDDPDALEYLSGVERAVRESERIFDFASAYEKLGVEQLAYVDVKKTVDEAVELFPDLKDVKMTNDCGGLALLADSLLRQLFYNLIDDSLKYGEKLTQIRIRYEKSKDQMKLVYEDDGVGISQDAKPKLFSEGYTTGKGSGYGLYLIRRMMEVYGWAISEIGTHGKGAQFTINVPQAKPDGRQNYKLS